MKRKTKGQANLPNVIIKRLIQIIINYNHHSEGNQVLKGLNRFEILAN